MVTIYLIVSRKDNGKRIHNVTQIYNEKGEFYGEYWFIPQSSKRFPMLINHNIAWGHIPE